MRLHPDGVVAASRHRRQSRRIAQALAPDELVRKVTADVLDAIKSDQQLQAGDRKKALALAEQKILPLVDFRKRPCSPSAVPGPARRPTRRTAW